MSYLFITCQIFRHMYVYIWVLLNTGRKNRYFTEVHFVSRDKIRLSIRLSLKVFFFLLVLIVLIGIYWRNPNLWLVTTLCFILTFVACPVIFFIGSSHVTPSNSFFVYSITLAHVFSSQSLFFQQFRYYICNYYLILILN